MLWCVMIPQYHAGGFGERPKPTVTVRMGEGKAQKASLYWCYFVLSVAYLNDGVIDVRHCYSLSRFEEIQAIRYAF